MRTDAGAARAVDQVATLLRSDQIPRGVRSLGAQAQLRLAEPIHLCIVGRAEATIHRRLIRDQDNGNIRALPFK